MAFIQTSVSRRLAAAFAVVLVAALAAMGAAQLLDERATSAVRASAGWADPLAQADVVAGENEAQGWHR